LTPANRALLAVIREKKPQSIAELAELTGRAQRDLTRTLGRLEAVGFVQMNNVRRRKAPTAAVHAFRVKIDPFSSNDDSYTPAGDAIVPGSEPAVALV
jgi:predicted transcriptional regulator